jgi:CTP synthase (UTP-ammonia lyase)
MSESVTIGIIGDYDGRFHAHVATNDALRHAAVGAGLVPAPPGTGPQNAPPVPAGTVRGPHPADKGSPYRALNIRWLPTEALAGADGESVLARCDGLWAAPGSPYRSMEGALRAIRFARERRWPFLGT